MPDDAPDHLFFDYLKCDLPLGYPLKSPLLPTLSIPLRERHRKDLLYQEGMFLRRAEQFRPTQAAIAYLAAVKHEAIVRLVPPETFRFLDVADQKYFNECEQKWKVLRKEARATLDDAAARGCERLVLLQREASKIEHAEKIIKAAIAAGYPALDPLPEQPPELAVGTLAWVLDLTNMKIRAANDVIRARLKTWHHHEGYHRLCGQALQKVSALPGEIRNDGLIDLSACVKALEALRSERAALETNYIPALAS